MTNKSVDAVRRADHALIGVLALFIATVSAAGGVAAVYGAQVHKSSTVLAAQVLLSRSAPQSKAVVTAAVVPAAMANTPVVTIDASQVRKASITISEDSVMGELIHEHRCLADALYYEARGESTQGEKAIAEVIFHRLHKGAYGNSICKVVYEGAGSHHCQFSFACNGEMRRPKSAGSWQKAQMLAARILVGQEYVANVTAGAVSFHAAAVAPDWSGGMEKTTQIGNHVFYKSAARRKPAESGDESL